MRRSEGRILTTHVGSLIRPQYLLDAIAAWRGGGSAEAYQYALSRAVEEIVRQQVEVGLDIVNDGEFSKSNWANYILERVTGFECRPDTLVPLHWLGSDRERFGEFMTAELPDAITGGPADVCVGEIAYVGHDIIERDTAMLNAAAGKAGAGEVFLTSVAPASVGYNGIDEFYGEESAYVEAIADALREEYQAIHKAGIVLQVDDAVLANMYDHLTQQDPENYRKWASLRVEALNHALAGIPAEQVRYHVCFGSWHVPHISDAPLEEIIDLVLSVNAGAFSIEAANVRHEHEVDLWEQIDLPRDKILIPGVITHHTTTVEHPQLVANRLVKFAEYVGPENVIAGADCGFAQVEEMQRVHPQVMWAKFEALVEGAQMASKKLWS